MAAAIRARKADILAANAQDLAEAKASGATPAFLDRLALDDKRVAAMADGLDVVRALADPVGLVTERWTRPNGMTIERVRVPLGVVGIIYESRPNVTADAAALCLKAGNAAILRGGSESHRSNRAIHAALIEGLRAAGLPEAAIALVPTRDRAAVGMMLAGLDGAIDVIVPRGGKSLVARVQAEARVPVFAHLEGICHVYVDRAAKLDMAKTHRAQRQDAAHRRLRRRRDAAGRSRGGADASQAAGHHAARCRLRGARRRGDARRRSAREGRRARRTGRPNISTPSSPPRWSTASTTRSRISNATARTTPTRSSPRTAPRRKNSCDEVDSAIVLHNASTQFADGGEFGFGAEIGIATGRFHARGPVGVEQLTSFKYRVRGSGQIRP